MPFLTRQQNVELDGEVLVALARQTVPKLPEHLAESLRRVAALDSPMSLVELAKVLPPVTVVPADLVDRARLLLRNDEVLVGLASELASNTLLWPSK